MFVTVLSFQMSTKRRTSVINTDVFSNTDVLLGTLTRLTQNQ